MRLCDHLFVMSLQEQSELRAFAPWRPSAVVKYPVTVDDRDGPGQEDPSWRLPPGVPILLFVGRLIAPKGIYDLLGAMPRLLQRSPCHLMVAGAGEDGRVRRLIAELGIGDSVTLVGYLEGPALSAAYRAASVFVLPTYWVEGFPLVVLEALFFGLPIVTTRIRGMADHLSEGVHALFVRSHSAADLADALARLLSDPDLRSSMSGANKELVRNFAPDEIGRVYVAALEGIGPTRRLGTPHPDRALTRGDRASAMPRAHEAAADGAR